MQDTLIKTLLLTLFPLCAFAQYVPSSDVVKNALSYHDPEGLWPELNARLYFEEVQPNGDIRKTEARIDNTTGYFRLNRGDYEIHGMKMDSCFVEKGDYDCARAERMRNYYVYLWGLPMKLMDEGTRIRPEASLIDWQNVPCYEVVVDYEEDRWYFYFTRDDYRMIGYMFVKHDGSGERIVLNGEKKVGSMKIPAQRSWFVLGDDRYLGTDRLVQSISQ